MIYALLDWMMRWRHRGHRYAISPDLYGSRRRHYYCDCGQEWVS